MSAVKLVIHDIREEVSASLLRRPAHSTQYVITLGIQSPFGELEGPTLVLTEGDPAYHAFQELLYLKEQMELQLQRDMTSEYRGMSAGKLVKAGVVTTPMPLTQRKALPLEGQPAPYVQPNGVRPRQLPAVSTLEMLSEEEAEYQQEQAQEEEEVVQEQPPETVRDSRTAGVQLPMLSRSAPLQGQPPARATMPQVPSASALRDMQRNRSGR